MNQTLWTPRVEDEAYAVPVVRMRSGEVVNGNDNGNGVTAWQTPDTDDWSSVASMSDGKTLALVISDHLYNFDYLLVLVNGRLGYVAHGLLVRRVKL